MNSVTPTTWPMMSIAQAHERLTAPGAPFEMDVVNIKGVQLRVWKNAPATLREVFANTAAYRDREFLIYENERVTYDAFRRAVLAFALELRAQSVRKGDRVAIAMSNLPEWPVAFFAAALCGAMVVPLNAWWTGDELRHALIDSGAVIIVADNERYERISQQLDDSDIARVYVARSHDDIAHPLVRQLEEIIGPTSHWPQLAEEALPDVSLQPEDVVTLFYTSGTTGLPKGALGTHRNICINTLDAAFVRARMLLRRGLTPSSDNNEPQKIVLLSVPLFHVIGCNASLVPMINAGNKIVLMPRWDADQALPLIERERVTQTGGVPTIAWQLVEHPQRESYDLSSLELISYGGSIASPKLVARMQQVFPNVIPGIGWGMTETAACFAGHFGEDYQHRPESCGVPAAIAEYKIMDRDGKRVLAVDEVGELWVRGPQVFAGYWKNPEATAQTLIDGWLRTGDMARLDAEGFCTIVDRIKDVLIRGGENIYCTQVENALLAHPAVLEAAVIGIPHPVLGEEPGAVVRLKPDHPVTEVELLQFLSPRLAAFAVPVSIKFWDRPLPRNAAGKLLKHLLK